MRTYYVAVYLLFICLHACFAHRTHRKNDKLHRRRTLNASSAPYNQSHLHDVRSSTPYNQSHLHDASSVAPFTRFIRQPLNQSKYEITKKSNIEDATNLIDKISHEPKNKRGFLANLATLLTDAEAIATNHKRQSSGLTSIRHSEKHVSIPVFRKGKLPKQDEKNDTSSIIPKTDKNITSSEQVPIVTVTVTNDTESDKKQQAVSSNTHYETNDEVSKKINNNTKKEEVPDLDDIRQAFKESSGSKDFAPIFAMFHGKIVPLGKLADTSFRKSHVEQEHLDINNKNTFSKDITANKRTFNDDENVNDEAIESTKLSKLQTYLTNLDGHVPSTSENVRGVAKDEVEFPVEEPAAQRSDLLNHVKGVVLDSGKVVSVNNNRLDMPLEEPVKEVATETTVDEKQKFFVNDDGTLNQVKSKPLIGEAVTRDKEGGEGQKTVAISLDVLKDLLKKTDTKISLAALLNKPAEAASKSETTAPQEEEDPGTIEDFAAGGLKAHNLYRTKHHDAPLVWSDDLAAKAQKLAESLADKKTLEIAKDLEKEGYGENVAKVWATFKNAGEAATKMWYSQSDNYHFDDPHLDENTGQFAQVVWKSTKEIGMGVAKSIDDVNNKYVYVTSLYRPPGNIEAQLRENVLPTGNNTVDVYTTFF